MIGIYARQSIEKKDSVSIEAQIEKCQSYFGNNAEYKIYKDAGYSGKNINRPQFTQLLEDINAIGTALYEKELQGKRIAIIGKNRYEWVISHLAFLFGGIVSVPLDKDLQIEELQESLIRSKVDAIIFDEKLTEKINVIKNLLSVNSPVETIAVAISLSVDEVKNIIKKHEINKNNV